MAKQLSFWQIYKWPVIIFMLSISGIFAALVVDGVSDLFASLMLVYPIIVTAWYVLRSKQR